MTPDLIDGFHSDVDTLIRDSQLLVYTPLRANGLVLCPCKRVAVHSGPSIRAGMLGDAGRLCARSWALLPSPLASL